MRTGTILSFLFHLAIALLLVFGLPDLFKSEEMVVEPVAVQLATVADLTQAPKPAAAPPKPVIKPADTPPPPAPQAPTPPPTPAPPAPPQAEQTPPQPQEAPPPPPAPTTPPQPQPAQPLPDLPQPEVIPDKTQETPPPQEAQVETPPKPQLRPPQADKPKPKPDKQQAQAPADFNTLLKNLTQNPQAQPPAETPPQPQTQVSEATAASIGQQLTSSELDAVRSQIAGCWFLDPGKKGADTIVVEVQVTLLPDGTVQSADIVDQARMYTDAVYRAAAEAAQRAILKCHQLHLPLEKYDLWKSTTFRFNPSGFFG
jgi:hypothetical protein